jgi:uncharacterized protein
VPSALGDWAYDVADTKLSRSAKPKHVLQLCVYAKLIGSVQEVLPPRMHVVLGSGEVVTLRTSAVAHYYSVASGRFEAYADAPGDVSAGEPCGHCRFCRWSEACEAEWEAADHLSIVAGITRGQIERLRSVAVNSIGDLAALPRDRRVQGIQPAAMERLVAQAGLQHHSRRTGENRLEVLPLERDRGFARLPRPDPGDIFFDMEGDPLFEEGLEYLSDWCARTTARSASMPTGPTTARRRRRRFRTRSTSSSTGSPAIRPPTSTITLPTRRAL